jgi:chitinase
MDPFDSMPPGGDGRRLDRLLVWAATAGALGCAVLIFLLTNAQGPDPVAEPAPTTGTAFPAAQSSTISAPTTTTTTAVPTTTVDPTATATQPPITTTPAHTTARRSSTTTRVTTTTTMPATSSRECQVAHWQRDTAYNGGAVVEYGGGVWEAKWWNYNAAPGANAEGVWVRAPGC